MVAPGTVIPPRYLGGIATPEIPKRSSLCQSHASWFRVAGAGDMTLIGGGTSHRVTARTAPALAGIRLGTGVAVGAGGAVNRCRVGALAGAGVAGAGHMALIGGGTSHWIAARAAACLTSITL